MTARIEEERLVAYVDGELDAEAVRAVEAAMAADPKLAATVAALRTEVALIRAAYQEPLRTEVPEHLVAAIDAAFAEGQAGRFASAGGGGWTPRRGPGRTRFRHPAFGAIAASIIAIVVGLAGANYFAERSVERAIARLEALRVADQEMIEAAVTVALEKHVSGQPARWRSSGLARASGDPARDRLPGDRRPLEDPSATGRGKLIRHLWYYATAGEGLLWTLKQGLEAAVTPEEERARTNVHQRPHRACRDHDRGRPEQGLTPVLPRLRVEPRGCRGRNAATPFPDKPNPAALT